MYPGHTLYDPSLTQTCQGEAVEMLKKFKGYCEAHPGYLTAGCSSRFVISPLLNPPKA